jgi:hypothetical protein
MVEPLAGLPRELCVRGAHIGRDLPAMPAGQWSRVCGDRARTPRASKRRYGARSYSRAVRGPWPLATPAGCPRPARPPANPHRYGHVERLGSASRIESRGPEKPVNQLLHRVANVRGGYHARPRLQRMQASAALNELSRSVSPRPMAGGRRREREGWAE